MKFFGFRKKTETCDLKKDLLAGIKQKDPKIGCRVKVLGSGCAKCHELLSNVEDALEEIGADKSVEFISDFAVIASYGVMSTPALVIDDKVVSSGRVLKKDEVITLYRSIEG
ncbi:MAG: thioredoxin family protein [Succinivibrio sp.]